jgi:uncharacterized protein (TIGR00106 family)
MAIAAVSISPIGAGVSVSTYVAAALRVARAQGRVRVELGSMFTTLEGEVSEIFALITAMQDAVFDAGGVRVSTVIKVDDRRDRAAAGAGKVAAVEALLAEPSEE